MSRPSDGSNPASETPSSGGSMATGATTGAPPTSFAGAATGGTTGLPGTGGTSSTGGFSMGTGAQPPVPPVGTGGTPVVEDSFAVRGYVKTDDWSGYAFTLAGGDATTEPACGISTCFETGGNDLCMTGTIPDSYEAVAGIGFNLKQLITGADPMPWVTTGTGVKIEVQNNVPGMGLRVQVQDADETTWCAELTGAVNEVPWSSFNTECWSGAGTALPEGHEIVQVAVIVPGTEAEVLMPDFCLVSAEPY